MRRRRMLFYVKNRKNLALVVCLLLAMLFTFLAMTIEMRMRPIVREIALSKAEYIATKAINDAINEEMSMNAAEYDNVVKLERNSIGEIIAVQLDIIKINTLKTAVISSVSKNLEKIEETTISIPLGNLINGELMSGRGPKINIKVLPISSVNATFASEFTSAGINQTRHRILINTAVYISVLLPGGPVGTRVNSEMSIAETVLIGNVPNGYTNIEDIDQDLLEKFNNYAEDSSKNP